MPRADDIPPRNESNPLCAKCVRRCRQPLSVRLLECPRFRPYPFKLEKSRFEQLPLFEDEP